MLATFVTSTFNDQPTRKQQPWPPKNQQRNLVKSRYRNHRRKILAPRNFLLLQVSVCNRFNFKTKWNGPSLITQCRSLCRVHCQTFATASSRCTVASSGTCINRAFAPTDHLLSALASLATRWLDITRTVMVRFTTRSCVWPNRFRCVIH